MKVVKELPKYVANTESNIPEEKPDLRTKEIDYLNHEVKEINSKLKVSYTVIFLLCFTLFGGNLIQNENYIINVFGLILLCSSLIGSIGVVWWSIVSKKMIE
jgi:hypothetical protein